MRISKYGPLAIVLLVLGLSFSGAAFADSGHKNVYTENRESSNNANNSSKPALDLNGKSLYETGCSTCHGLDGNGTPGIPTLHNVGKDAVEFYVGTGRMPLNAPMVQAPRRKPTYTQEQTEALANYVESSFGSGPNIAGFDPTKGDIVEGNLLFTNNCAGCHNSAGSGGALGRGYYAPNLYDATPKQVAQAMRTGPGAMPVFGDKQFDAKQMNSIVKYVETLREPKNPGGFALGHIGPVSEGMIAWTFALGLLLAIARWIGTRV